MRLFPAVPLFVSCCWRLAALSALALIAAAPAGDEHAGHGSLGKVEFPVSCSPAAQAEFNGAVALLHHMTYPQAREAFRELIKHDPACAMGYWGFAMTLFQPLWPTRPSPAALEQGWEAVQKAKELGPPTDARACFVAAAEAFFQDPKVERLLGAHPPMGSGDGESVCRVSR